MNENQKRSLIDRYLAAYNQFDVRAMLTLLHPEIEFRNVASGEVTASASGLEEFRQLAERSTATLVSHHQEVTGFRDDGDITYVDVHYKGLIAIDLPNGLRAGDRLHLDGRSEFGFRDGKISQITDYS